MAREPNLVTSGMSRHIIEDDTQCSINICKLEGDAQWSLEGVMRDGTSIVWDDLFDNNAAAFEAAILTIREEGPHDFECGGSNVVPFKR